MKGKLKVGNMCDLWKNLFYNCVYSLAKLLKLCVSLNMQNYGINLAYFPGALLTQKYWGKTSFSH